MSESSDKEDALYVVGIGASAGGVAPIQKFFKSIDIDPNITYFVIQHLSSDYYSYMNELISKNTELEVITVEENTKIEASKIYICHPSKYLTLVDNEIRVHPKKSGQDHIINLFFTSLAKKKEKAIAIVLSGAGEDGKQGVEAVKRNGGGVIIQDHSSAEYQSMPLAAISTGMADYICKVEEIYDKIKLFIENPILSKLEKDLEEIDTDSQILSEILAIVEKQTYINFNNYKNKSILRRIGRRMTIVSKTTLEEYKDYLEENSEEILILGKELLIGVTEFFRDPDVFDTISRDIIPKLFDMNSENKSIRIWIPGCSTGEEAYSYSMMLENFKEQVKINYTFKIFATDVDEDAIKYASRGKYTVDNLKNVDEKYLRKYTTISSSNTTYQMKDIIRKNIIFSVHNVLDDPPFLNIDLISCRNLLIYFKPKAQNRTFSLFKFGLNKDGYLVLGTAGTIKDQADFKVVNASKKIFQFKGANRAKILESIQLNQVSPPQVTQAKRQARNDVSDLVKEINTMVVNELAAPSVVIDMNYKLVQVYGDVNEYLTIPPGSVTNNLIDMVRDEISVAIQTTVRKTIKEEKKSNYRSVIEKENKKYVNIVSIPIKLPKRDLFYVMINFIEEPVKPRLDQQEDLDEPNQDLVKDLRETIADLEDDLKNKEENLQITIEELETANEELQSTNEELQSSNEELQSTNEEIQSVNEELNTVNSEYIEKIKQLTLLNSDLDNLIMSTNIGYIFLNEDLKVRKFSDNVQEVVNLNPERDINRKITDISVNFTGDLFIEEIKKVYIEGDGVVHDMESRTTGKAHHVSIQPYHVDDKAKEGIVITISDL